MEYIVLVFRSRSYTVKFSEVLNKYGIRNEIINTPKEANVGCGLSVKFSKTDYPSVKRVLTTSVNAGLYQMFYVTVKAGKRFLKSI